jgi:glycosyltransferase involved in cell wall biosynthesis
MMSSFSGSNDSNKLEGGVGPKGTAPLVFWDGSGLGSPYSGIANYGANLFSSLKKLNVEPTIIAPSMPCFGQQQTVIAQPRIFAPLGTSKLFWPEAAFKHAARLAQGKRAVFHGLANINAPLLSKAKNIATVLTVHDLIPLLVPTQVSKAYFLQFSFAMNRLVKRVDGIACCSEWTAATLRERYPNLTAKVVVVRNGRPKTFDPKFDRSSKAETDILTVSRFEPYKNLGVIGKVAQLSDPSLKFHVVSDTRCESYYREHFGKLLAEGRIKLYRDLSEEALDVLFKKSHCYFQPSTYEGFCIPVMTALSHALPIVYLQGSAIGETALPEFSVGVDRNDADAFLEAIYLAIKKSQKPDFIEITKSLFLKFPTWDDAALKLKNLYTDLAP